MRIKSAPNLKRLRNHFKYNEHTGLFFFRKTGKQAGCLRPDGYWYLTFERERHLAHRIAWYYVHGVWPLEIDHKNRNRSDTRIKNLRSGTRTQNIGNGAGWAAKKKSGLPRGVYFHPADKTRFRAQIFIKYKAVHLGIFETVDEAVTAYEVAAREHFGEFAT